MMKNDPSVGEVPFPPSLRDAAAARPFVRGASGVLAVSPIAIHEAAHCVVARYLGLPVAGVTLVASADYAGLCFGPDTDPSKVTSSVLREEAERRCNDATELLPLPGMRRDCTASWLVHAQSLVMESMAGFVGEELGGFDRELEAKSTDYTVAKLYARSVVMSDEAVSSFVESCRADAMKILKDHWQAVEAVATALDERKTLTGIEIDEIIIEAEQRAVMLAEKQRRAAMAAKTEHARFFRRLRELFSYDPDTGIIARLISTSSNARAGDVAGCVHKASGYLIIRIGGRLYKAHRLAFLFMTGIWPPHQIDHVNLDRADNRWVNLRMATGAQNSANTRVKTSNKSGFKGVVKGGRKWEARIQVNGKPLYLGSGDTREEAAALYADAAVKYYGEFARVE